MHLFNKHMNKHVLLHLPVIALLVSEPCLSAAADTGSSQSDAQTVTYLEQGWTPKIRELFYYTPQGSRLIPYKWLQVLEQASNTERFMDPTHQLQYGWLLPENTQNPLNPAGFPIGFTIDPVDVPGTGQWAGLTCSACHTNDITFKGQTLRIDGAPASADFDVFLTDLSNAVQATLLSPDKFQRFSRNILGAKPHKTDVQQLRQAYEAFAAQLAGRVWMRTPPVPTGPGRVDALGQIVTALSVFDLQEPDNLRAPDAPVSYPFLWYTPKLDWVQWNPIASNPIARNAGEVLGVFGHAHFTGSDTDILRTQIESKLRQRFQQLATDITPPEWRQELLVPLNDKMNKKRSYIERLLGKDNTGLFASTVLYKNLFELEQWLVDLEAPEWQNALLGQPDAKQVKQGAALFQKDCVACHNMPPFAMTRQEDNIIGKQFIKIGRTPYQEVATDPVYVESLIQRFSKTGALGSLLFEDQRIIPAGRFFLGSVEAVVEKGLSDLGLSSKEKLAYSDYRFYPPKAPGEKPEPYKPPSIDSLKAGPLLGIWATGPFLHNGSVPNIYELLSPPEERSSVFWVGSRELDTEKLGFVSEEQPGLFRFDTQLKGNGNGGHRYPQKPYSHAQRMAVIEFLKAPIKLEKRE